MTTPNLRADIHDPKTLAAMDQAFAAVWRKLRADDPFRDYASDSELRIAIGKKLLNLVADGVTDPLRLELSPWRACFCHAIEMRVVPPNCFWTAPLDDEDKVDFEESVKWTTYCRTWCSGSARSSSC